jgi:hypothetical protein
MILERKVVNTRARMLILDAKSNTFRIDDSERRG